ncbi:MAG: ABC transporter substrate-binding protein [Candidatus Binataceae bacterium]|jgi:phospholipid transport system substrate-binding protein
MHVLEARFLRGYAIAGGVLSALITFGVVRAHADPGFVVRPRGAVAATAASSDPMAQVRSGVRDVMDVFKVPEMPLKIRREKLRELGAKYFDFNSMARSVMGYHWRELSPGQRIEFVAVFTRFIEDAYLSKLQDYSVKKVADELPSVNIQFTREAFDGPDYAQVYSTVMLKEQKDPIELNYLMHLTDGKWKVYDVTVDAISVIGNYRNQINRTINEGSYDQLITNLRTKTAALQQELDNPNPTRE